MTRSEAVRRAIGQGSIARHGLGWLVFSGNSTELRLGVRYFHAYAAARENLTSWRVQYVMHLLQIDLSIGLRANVLGGSFRRQVQWMCKAAGYDERRNRKEAN